MPAWVLLRHDLPDGTWHWDWLLELAGPEDAPRADPDARTLFSLRLPASLGNDWTPDQVAPGVAFSAHRLPDHRRLYLSFEGEISGNRGRVSRRAAGHFDLITHTPVHVAITLVSNNCETRWHFDAAPSDDNPDHWQLTRLAR